MTCKVQSFDRVLASLPLNFPKVLTPISLKFWGVRNSSLCLHYSRIFYTIFAPLLWNFAHAQMQRTAVILTATTFGTLTGFYGAENPAQTRAN